jgi:uncharacterized protein (TIGR00369 family)
MNGNGRLNFLINNDNFMKNFHIEVEEERPGFTKILISITENMMRIGNVVNGGVIAGLYDISGALTVFTIADVMNSFTISLNVNFVETLSGAYCRINSKILKQGKRHFFLNMEILDEKQNVTSTGSGIWAVVR